jgi:hypothetical protein
MLQKREEQYPVEQTHPETFFLARKLNFRILKLCHPSPLTGSNHRKKRLPRDGRKMNFKKQQNEKFLLSELRLRPDEINDTYRGFQRPVLKTMELRRSSKLDLS